MPDLVYPKRLLLYPGETRDLYVDFEACEELRIDDETLAGTPTVAVSPAGPTLGTPAISGTKVVVATEIDTDEAAGAFTILFTVDTSGGSTLVRPLEFDVADV